MKSLSNLAHAMAGALCWLAVSQLGCSNSSEQAANKPANKSVPVKTVTVDQQDVQRTTTQPATVHPYYRAEVRAKVSGFVKDLKADIGDYVEADATLAIIDVPEMEKQRQILEAQIARHESQEKQAEAGVTLAQAQVKSSEAKKQQAESESKRAEAMLAAVEAEFTRTSDLVERQSVEKRLLDEVRKKRDSELANQATVKAAITSAGADVAVAQAHLVAAEADLAAAKTNTSIARRQLEELDVLIGYATLKAPFAGVVTQRTVDPGNLVREGNEVGKGEPLFVLSQIDKVRVRIPVPETDAALVSRGDSISLTFPSFPAEEAIQATVTRLSGDLDPSTRTMLVEAEVPNKDHKLIPGMFGQATITLETKVATNTLPARAIRFE